MMPGIPYGPPKFKNMKLERKQGIYKFILEAKKEEEVVVVVQEPIQENN